MTASFSAARYDNVHEAYLLIIVFQAASHCVNFTCSDFQANAKKAETVVLTDCQSAVGTFEKQAEDFFERMKAASATLVESTALTL